MSETSSNEDDDVVELWTREETALLRVPVAPNNVSIEIGQYGSHDARWGIFSCIWDGGLGLIEYIRVHQPCSKDALVIDVGSGTGIVGLGLAALGFTNVVLTDLKDATGLLMENAKRNSEFPIHVEELTWGEEVSESIQRRMEAANDILILGADIVYRQNLFDPLLTTLLRLWRPSVKCIFATQSTRQHLVEFWARACERGLSNTHVANVIVPQGVASPEQLPHVVSVSDERRIGIVNVLQVTRESCCKESA